MAGFQGKLPVLRGLSPFRTGLADGAASAGLVTAFFGVTMNLASLRPTPDMLQAAGQIGATLLVAYAIEISWLMRASRRRSLEEREVRLGAFTAIGAAAALGIAFSLVLTGRAEAGNWTAVDGLGAGWVAASLIWLGVLVVMQPWVTHEWMYEDDASVD